MNIENFSKEFGQAIDFLKNEIAQIRTGRANPAMVENILIESYGTKTPLKQLSSISVPEARTIIIQPWDKNILKDVEKSIITARLNLSPAVDGGAIRLNIPPLTEENRKELVKMVGEKVEKTKISLRQIRDKIKDQILKEEKNKQITEDDRYDLIKDLDDTIKEYNEKVDNLGAEKEKEIMTI
ncbi:ribosome recycling factor [Candidatus Parcubacteria bacterium]|nr:MAG: ribosome recycling factor [Candidatus Parcubacteria bacterium]